MNYNKYCIEKVVLVCLCGNQALVETLSRHPVSLLKCQHSTIKLYRHLAIEFMIKTNMRLIRKKFEMKRVKLKNLFYY